MSEESNGTTVAPDGCIYVCGACGRTSLTRYGYNNAGRRVAMLGWDESCMMNSALFREADLTRSSPGGRVTKIKEGAEPIGE